MPHISVKFNACGGKFPHSHKISADSVCTSAPFLMSDCAKLLIQQSSYTYCNFSGLLVSKLEYTYCNSSSEFKSKIVIIGWEQIIWERTIKLKSASQPFNQQKRHTYNSFQLKILEVNHSTTEKSDTFWNFGPPSWKICNSTIQPAKETYI